MRKRLLAVLLILSLTGTLFAGCGTHSEQSITKEDSVTEPAPDSSELSDPAEEPTIAVEPNESEDTTEEEISDITEQPASAETSESIETIVPTETPEPTDTITPTENPTPTEAITPSENPESVEIPTPTETPTSTKDPDPTVAPKPTATPVPTATPKPTATPVPTATPKPTATPAPTATPKPTATPVPTATPKPTATPVPTATPRPTATPAPTATPKPTSTPKPTKAPVHHHEYLGEPTVITPPTCTTAGTGVVTCSCGETLTVEIRKTNCTYETIRIEPTCTEEGKSTTYCTICGSIKSERVLSKRSHDERGWETVREATCTTEGLRCRTCFTCGEVTTSETIPCWDNHPFEWHTEGDTRTNICSECGFVGITEYRYGDAWGYFDDAEAADLWYWINEQRKASLQGVVDDWGNPIGIKNIDPLIADASLTELARTRCTEIATDFSHGSYLHENLAWGYPTGRDVYVAWCYSRSHARAMIDPEYIYGGTAFFWYDGNDSGINLTPLAVLTFSY